MSIVFRPLALAALAASLVSCATAKPPIEQRPAPQAALQPIPAQAAAPRARRLVVVGINDTHGALNETPPPKWLRKETKEPIGGAAWFAGWMDAVRKDAAEREAAVVILDAGDLFQGTLISNQFKGRSVVDVYDAVGVTAAAVGNHEFDFGMPVLEERMREAHFPILVANVFDKGTRTRPAWAHPTALVEVAGVKVGIIGLATIETPTVTNPVNVAQYDFADGAPIAAELAAELRKAGATVVLVTAHAGPLDGDGDRPSGPSSAEAQHIAEACKGLVDGVVSGHHHTSVGCCPPGEARCRCGTGPLTVAGIPIVQSGAKLTAFSTIELELDGAGHATSARVNAGTTPHEGAPQVIFHQLRGQAPTWRGRAVAIDTKVAAIVQKYDAEVSQLRESRIGATEVPLVKGGQDDLLANLAADAMRSGAGGGLPARYAFQNQGGLRIPEIPAGPISFGQIFDLSPFDNEQVVLTLKAPQVRDALESVVKAGKGSLRVSGLRYTVDLSRAKGRSAQQLPAGAVVTEVIDEQSGKAICRTLSCTDSACTATCAEGDYTVSVTDFLANGGDGLGLLKSAPRQVGPVLSRDILIAYVKEHSPLTAAVLGSTKAGGKLRIQQQSGSDSAEHE